MKQKCEIPKCTNILTNLDYGLCCSKECDNILSSIKKEVRESYRGFKGSNSQLIIGLRDTLYIKLNQL